jgi:3-hydroxybutyryl-CoA dehydrogenase
VRPIGIAGAGTMGAGIAALAAGAGFPTRLYDPDPQVLARAPDGPTPASDLTALGACDLVIEAAPENLDLKRDLFRRLAEIVSADCVLATNTSSLSVTAIAAEVPAPERVVGMHFFNPPSMMQLVEVIPGLDTTEETVDAALKLAAKLGKKGIRVKETPGFVVNRVLIAMMNEACNLYEEGAASIEDIDEAMKLGAGMPMGPFRLADLVGLDVYMHTCESIYAELGSDKFRPPLSLKQHVSSGRLGRKSRHGFYKY